MVGFVRRLSKALEGLEGSWRMAPLGLAEGRAILSAFLELLSVMAYTFLMCRNCWGMGSGDIFGGKGSTLKSCIVLSLLAPAHFPSPW